ncbi:MAG: Fe-S protein, homolog of lactate dehydrogenase SO1521 [uncultured Paraburkholderia sp.]|nr:MAG: Fe-S protein, homolog of lactate dehydrogenase SO1521 [uncultured Paraburkholderia sp.]CAH2915942.1 MAG: Fe-S protein, homolog of lactate dehydrogenase SO1521 [uncultured Paraburkholderia sp.]
MVHNVEAIDAILADGSEAHFASLRNAPQGARLQQIVEGVRRIAQRERDEIVARVPKVLRRVAGYNIDLFDCQNPRAYTDDGVENLAHLLVGSEGTLAFSRQLTLKLAPLPAHKTLGIVNFPTFWQAMDLTQHIVKLKPVAVELVDRTMIDLAMSNPAFRPVVAKALFDPDNRFNPDKMVRPPKMDDARYFRFAPGYREQRMETALDWSAWNVQRDPLTGRESAPGSGNDLSGGLAKAVEMCNNNGHCRKFDAGTMCPSYRVTKDEQHVTRGRANTLRLAISGQLGETGLASDDVKDTLDLCVSCKGCKRDCPTGVDMAKFKIEARAARVKRHGLTLRDKLVAFMPRYAATASRVPGLIALADKVPLLSAWLKRSVGFAGQRSLPRFARPFLSTVKPTVNTRGAALKEVLLFVDTFNNHMEPDNARAAQKVLEVAGYTVHFNTRQGERPVCCGRTFFAAGLVDEAKHEARRMPDLFEPFVARGVPVVGLEPSCLLSLRDEFLHYGFGDEAAQLAKHAFLFEEFLVREQQAGRLQLSLKPLATQQALVHGHCHQKAFDAFEPVQTVLKWIPELKVSTVESSCCGMAGSFGYEAEHYATSQAMAELSLLPAVRKMDAGAIMVADGTSCRHQIHDGAGVKAMHVARVLAMALQ